MKVEVTCQFGSCDFKTSFDWPDNNGRLEKQSTIKNPMSEHHDATKPNMPEWRGFTAGHGKFIAKLENGLELKITATSNYVLINEGQIN